METIRRTGRERIMDSALELFARRPFDSVTIREIGDQAGLTNPALYRHFADKEALGLALYRRCYAQLVAETLRATERLERPLEKIAAYGELMIGRFEAQPEVLLYIDEHQARFWPRLRAEFGARALSAQVESWIMAGRASGEIPAISLPALQTALVMGLLSQWFAMRIAGLVTPAPDGAMATFLVSSLCGERT